MWIFGNKRPTAHALEELGVKSTKLVWIGDTISTTSSIPSNSKLSFHSAMNHSDEKPILNYPLFNIFILDRNECYWKKQFYALDIKHKNSLYLYAVLCDNGTNTV